MHTFCSHVGRIERTAINGSVGPHLPLRTVATTHGNLGGAGNFAGS